MNIRSEIRDGPDGSKGRLLASKRRSSAPHPTALTDVVVQREDARRTDMRREGRPLGEGQKVNLIFRQQTHDAELVNISGGGAMVCSPLKPNIAESVGLQFADNHVVECLVRWVKSGRLGLEFAHETQLECAEEIKAALLRRVIDARTPANQLKMSSPFEREEQRSSERHPLIWSGELLYRTHCWGVRLRNISETGALVECSGALREGSEVVLDLGAAGSLPAAVTWAIGDHAGLRFQGKFDVGSLWKSKPDVAPPRWLRPAYLQGDANSRTAPGSSD